VGTLLSTVQKLRRKEILILIACLLIGFGLRFYAFDRKSLWIDEVHTFNDSRDGLKAQIAYFKENPVDLFHPPLFFILTHLFYPFEKPERDLRIIPLIFGTLSIPMIFFLARLFSPAIALPVTLSLTFMAYHISFSQDGRSYTLLIFLGMAGLYFFIKHLQTSKKRYLVPAAIFFAISFYTSYASIPFIALFQILWFYQVDQQRTKPALSSFLIMNGLTLLLCLPWILFLILNYQGQPLGETISEGALGSFGGIVFGILNDWVPLIPLTVVSIVVLVLFSVVSRDRKNAVLLIGIFILPVVMIYLFCSFYHIHHYFSSRYVINFLPLFFIAIYLSLHTLQLRFGKWARYARFQLLFLILLIASNLVILPLYYRFEKQNFRGLVAYLDAYLRDGDRVFVRSSAYLPGILHYFGVMPKSRHYYIPTQKDPQKGEFESKISLVSQSRRFTFYYSNFCCDRYVEDGRRLWIIVGKPGVKKIMEELPFTFRGYFDGSFSNFRRFPSDASMYLFLWDPRSQGEKRLELPIE
jgi:hypothetical protein